MINEKRFKKWLTQRGYSRKTVETYTKEVQLFAEWCSENSIDANKATVDELYDFTDSCREKYNALNFARGCIGSLKHYYKCIGRSTNPALLISLEKKEKTLPRNLLNEEALLSLYMCIVPSTFIKKRNKVMLGLMIFQAVKRKEFNSLKVEHLDLKNKQLYIPSDIVSNSRYVELKEFQIHELQTYLYELRPQLLIEAKKDTDQLFFSMGTGNKMNNAFTKFIKEIRVNAPYIESFKQLRQSRISLWIKEHGVRKAQYLSGVKYPTSLERYRDGGSENLRNKLKLIHPMERLGM